MKKTINIFLITNIVIFCLSILIMNIIGLFYARIPNILIYLLITSLILIIIGAVIFTFKNKIK